MEYLSRWVDTISSVFEFHLQRWYREYIVAIAALVLVWLSMYGLLLSPPFAFPRGEIVVISQGSSLPAITKQLVDANILAHPLVFTIFIRALGSAGALHAGAYSFPAPENSLTVAWRIINGETKTAQLTLTMIPGMTAQQLSAIVARKFSDISASQFLSASQPYEGYLFPDTYAFLPDATPVQIVAKMRTQFDKQIAPQQAAIIASGHSLSEIVIMASIVEREAATPIDKKIVAGILWNRIARGMPLQVDAVFGYIEARSTFAPSLQEITTDSPYNTYLHKGLPPGPISNPGMDSLIAAINPTKSNYVYYLSDRNGNLHYAVTFAQQLANQRLYLR